MKFATTLLMCRPIWQLFPDGRLQGSFQLISRHRLWREFVVLLQHDTPDMIAMR